MAEPTFKVVLVGDAKVGKSSILSRWIHDVFYETYESTVSPEFSSKAVRVDGQVYRLQVWDIGFAEQETAAQFPAFVSGASGALLIYDLSDPASFDGVTHWHEQVQALAGSEYVPVVIGCKSDLKVADGVVQRADAFCKSIYASHVKCSAKRGENISVAFEVMCRDIIRAPSRPAPPVPAPVPERAGAPRDPGNSNHKVVLIGDSKVGKSALLSRWTNDAFFDGYEATVSPEFTGKEIVVNGQTLRLQVWDIGFAEADTAVQFPRFVNGATGIVLLYDLSDSDTFEGVSHWLEQARALAGKNCSFVIVGCKSDLQQVPGLANRAQALAQKINGSHVETSSKRGDNVMAVFETLGKLLLNPRPFPANFTPLLPAEAAPVAQFGSRNPVASSVDTIALGESAVTPQAKMVKSDGIPPPSDRERAEYESAKRRLEMLKAEATPTNSSLKNNATAVSEMESASAALAQSLKRTDAFFRGPKAANPPSSFGVDPSAQREQRDVQSQLGSRTGGAGAGAAAGARPEEPKAADPLPKRSPIGTRRPGAAGAAPVGRGRFGMSQADPQDAQKADEAAKNDKPAAQQAPDLPVHRRTSPQGSMNVDKRSSGERPVQVSVDVPWEDAPSNAPPPQSPWSGSAPAPKTSTPTAKTSGYGMTPPGSAVARPQPPMAQQQMGGYSGFTPTASQRSPSRGVSGNAPGVGPQPGSQQSQGVRGGMTGSVTGSGRGQLQGISSVDRPPVTGMQGISSVDRSDDLSRSRQLQGQTPQPMQNRNPGMTPQQQRMLATTPGPPGQQRGAPGAGIQGSTLQGRQSPQQFGVQGGISRSQGQAAGAPAFAYGGYFARR